MIDEFYNDPELMYKSWYGSENLMSRLTPEKMQWALCWGYLMEEGFYPPRLLGTKDDIVTKPGYYKATWESNVTCIGWIRHLLETEGVGGVMWLDHLDCDPKMSVKELSRHYGYDIETVVSLMNIAINHACKKHMENKHLWGRQ